MNRQLHCNKKEEGKDGRRCMYRCQFHDGRMSGFLSDTLVFLMKCMARSEKSEGAGAGSTEDLRKEER